MVADIRDYVEDSEGSVFTLAVKGKAGAGKSLFARCLVIEVLKDQREILGNYNQERRRNNSNKYFSRDMTFEVIVSVCNPEVAKQFLGVWTPVLRKMLLMLAV
jgi:hypothetical protein